MTVQTAHHACNWVLLWNRASWGTMSIYEFQHRAILFQDHNLSLNYVWLKMSTSSCSLSVVRLKCLPLSFAVGSQLYIGFGVPRPFGPLAAVEPTGVGTGQSYKKQSTAQTDVGLN